MKTLEKSLKQPPQPLFWQGDHRGILLIHGFTGTTAELAHMGKYFHEKGMTVYAPLLTGHGTAPEDMAITTWKDWWSSTVKGYKKLVNQGCTSIYAAGLSMGGLLALNVALNYELKGVISLCTPIYVRDRRIHFVPLLKRVIAYSNRDGEKLPHIEKEIYIYQRTPLRSLESLLQFMKLMKKRISKVNTPIFIAQSKKDETVRPQSATYIYNGIGSADKELHWYENSTHIITLDVEKEKLFTDVAAFIDRLEKG